MDAGWCRHFAEYRNIKGIKAPLSSETTNNEP